MTLRRFMVLVRGLGPDSVTHARLSSARYFGTADRVAATPDESERLLGAFFGFTPRRVH